MWSKLGLAVLATGMMMSTGALADRLDRRGGGEGLATNRSDTRAPTPHESWARGGHNHGANQKGFCPPGQRKKPGRGSAHNC